MKKLSRFFSPLSILAVLPVVAAAAGPSLQMTFDTIMFIFNQYLVPLVFGLAFITFIWGVFQFYIFEGQDVEGQKKGHMLMLWGIIGFALMFSVWGIVHIVTDTFGLSAVPRPEYPLLNK